MLGNIVFTQLKYKHSRANFFDSNMATILQMNFAYIPCRFV